MSSTQSEPALSVLMADFNTPAENLRAAVRSILAQEFTDFEFIIVDDASDRPTQKILEGFTDERLIVIRHQENQGFAAALNTGIEAARGEYLVRMDTDDWVEPSYIATLYRAIVLEPEYTVISCRAREFSDDGSTGAIVGFIGEKRRGNIIRGDVPVHAASIMRRADLAAVGGYPNYRRSQDYALWCELILAGRRLKVIAPTLYYYRVNLSDYDKRRLWSRRYGIWAKVIYFPRMKASALDYWYIVKSIVAGVLPARSVKAISEKRRRQN